MSGVVSTLAKERAQAAGLGTKTNPAKYLNQDFEELKSKCLSSGQLFCDPTFPAAPESMGFKEFGPRSYKTRGVEWKRPGELCLEPKFIVSGATRTDICQGAVGNCWLMAAIASLTLSEDILARVIYPDQSFETDYAGIFHFQLWQYGQWVDVVIDDLLPARNGKLLFLRSVDKNEYWSALLEKAYAKISGSYEAMKGGSATEGFEDFTGGIPESYELSKAPPNLFTIIKQALSQGSLLSTYIRGNAGEIETVTVDQLVKTHAYSLTGAEEVHVDGTLVKLVRLRNPWGFKEWNGAWSDNAKEWDLILPQEKAKLHDSADDGEFWMAYSDFVQHYSNVEICNLTPEALSCDVAGQWAPQQFEGSWKGGSTAGGYCKDTFWTNPQYRISLLEEDIIPGEDKVASSFLVALMQKDRRRSSKPGWNMFNIGFCLFKVPEECWGSQTLHLEKNFFEDNVPCACSETFAALREVCGRFQLPRGDYFIVPTTQEPGQEADFILRVFADKHSKTQETGNEMSFTLEEERKITEQDINASFRAKFAEHAGGDKEISAEELRTFLNATVAQFPDIKTDGFSAETCRCIVDLFDKDGNARLGLVEFQILWDKITKWLEIFQKFDLDKSGTMSSYEMRLALESAGFKLNNKLNQLLVARYADKEVIDFDNFVSCLVKLETVLRAFQQFDTDGTGVARLNVSEWLQLTMCG